MKTRMMLTAALVLGVSGGIMSGAMEPQPKAEPAQKVQPKTDGAKKEKKEPTLKAGMAAPSIKVDKWVKGEEVKSLEMGKVYVVEFWATWCPPCRKSIPHLTELQKKHRELTIIGVTSSERKEKDGTDKRLEKLEKFVKEQGDKMDYRVAYDSDREMFKDWMVPAGQDGIPCSFIVGHDGKIAWIGNPLSDKFDGEIEKALAAAKSKS